MRPLPIAEKALKKSVSFPPDLWKFAEDQAALRFSGSLSAYLQDLIRSDRDGETPSAPDKQLAQACRNFVADTLTSDEDRKRRAAEVLTSEVIRVVVSEIGGLSKRYPVSPASNLLAAESPPGDKTKAIVEKLTKNAEVRPGAHGDK